MLPSAVRRTPPLGALWLPGTDCRVHITLPACACAISGLGANVKTIHGWHRPYAGSGKTLAYLAPLAQALRAQEAAGGGGMAPKAPRALVLAPTSELCVQVGCHFFIMVGCARCQTPGMAVIECWRPPPDCACRRNAPSEVRVLAASLC